MKFARITYKLYAFFFACIATLSTDCITKSQIGPVNSTNTLPAHTPKRSKKRLLRYAIAASAIVGVTVIAYLMYKKWTSSPDAPSTGTAMPLVNTKQNGKTQPTQIAKQPTKEPTTRTTITKVDQESRLADAVAENLHEAFDKARSWFKKQWEKTETAAATDSSSFSSEFDDIALKAMP